MQASTFLIPKKIMINALKYVSIYKCKLILFYYNKDIKTNKKQVKGSDKKRMDRFNLET